MAFDKIRLFPDPILRKKSEKISAFDASLERIVRELERTMKGQPHGIGIAAPQIGIPKRIALVDVSSRIPNAGRLVLINPEILELLDARMRREGCMSLPEYTADVKRYQIARVRWQDLAGEVHEKVCQGIEAVCIQHEVDHLDGILFIDRVVSLKRDIIPRPRSA